MRNLKTVQSNHLQAHLDRLQGTAEFLAELQGGESLAGRMRISNILGACTEGLVLIKDRLVKAREDAKNDDPVITLAPGLTIRPPKGFIRSKHADE